MSEKLGPLTFGQKNDSVFLGRDLAAKRDLSERVAKEIDFEIKQFVTENYERAKRVLTDHMAGLNALAEALLAKESLDALDIDRILTESSAGTVPA
jgi:cell division protease FtsH